MPFLKLLMPLATSPMIEEILPLPPNSSSATARKMSQCQTLKPPISLSLLLQPRAALHICRTIAERRGAGQVCRPIGSLRKSLGIQGISGARAALHSASLSAGRLGRKHQHALRIDGDRRPPRRAPAPRLRAPASCSGRSKPCAAISSTARSPRNFTCSTRPGSPCPGGPSRMARRRMHRIAASPSLEFGHDERADRGPQRAALHSAAGSR